MPDEKRGQNEQEAQTEGQQSEAMPTSNKPAEETQEDELPQDASERTRQEFEKLKQRNKEMSEKLDKFESQDKAKKMPSVLDAYLPGSDQMEQQQQVQQPQQAQQQGQQQGQQQQNYNAPSANQFSHLNQQQVDKAVNNFVDDQGYVDVNALNNYLSQANNRARQAEERARLAEQRAQRVEDKVTRYEVNQQARDLHKAYPEIDPDSDQFNEEAYDLVKKELLNQLVQTGNQDAMTAAKKVEHYFRKDPQEEQQQRQVEAREQATVNVGTGTRQPVTRDVPKGAIRSKDALKARLEAAGY